MALRARPATIGLVFGGVLAVSAAAGWILSAGGDEAVSTIVSDSEITLPNGGMSSQFDGEALPATPLEALDGTKLTLTELGTRGKPMLINLWAESCRACRDEMPEFERAFQDLGDQMGIVGINVQDSVSQAAAYGDEVGVTYELFVDVDRQLVGEFEITALPATLIVAADGTIEHLHLGVLDADRIRTLAADELAQ
jgi:cytochrome c biogenesis protein CcmG, thiol:disulfide interchange protein DsbE